MVYADGRKAAAAKPDDGAAVRGPAAAADDESEDEDVDIDAIWVICIWFWQMRESARMWNRLIVCIVMYQLEHGVFFVRHCG